MAVLQAKKNDKQISKQENPRIKQRNYLCSDGDIVPDTFWEEVLRCVPRGWGQIVRDLELIIR